MSATDDVARMLTMVPWLVERPGASVAETAAAFGVTEKAVRRDLQQHLDFCGLPGLGGGDLFDVDISGDRITVQMADELRRPVRPTPAEALQLVLGLDAVADVLADEVPALRSAVDVVRAALGVPDHLADVLEPPTSAVALAARRAVREERRVTFAYQGRADDEPRTRRVDPFAVRLVDGVWYLQGHDLDVDQLRTFRLDRAAALEVTGVAATSTLPDTLPAPAYRPSDGDLRATVHLDVQARWFVDAVAVEERRELADGGLEVELTTDAPRYLVQLVLMCAGHARVVDPPALVAQVAAAAGAAVEATDRGAGRDRAPD